MRANPNESGIVLRLAETLAGQYQTEEAIEMYWRAFDRAEELDHKLDVVRKLTELYLQRGQLDRLFARLAAPGARRSTGREQSPGPRRRHVPGPGAMPPRATWGAPAPSSSGCWPPIPATPGCSGSFPSWPRKRATWKPRLAIRNCTKTWPRATKGKRGWAALLAKAGDLEEAQAVWAKAAAGKSQSFRVFLAMDNLLANGKPLPVLEITERMLRDDPATGRRFTARGSPSNSSARPRRRPRGFRSSPSSTVGDDEKSAFAKAQAQEPQASGQRRGDIAADPRRAGRPTAAGGTASGSPT